MGYMANWRRRRKEIRKKKKMIRQLDTKLGYQTYQKVLRYYYGEEDGLDLPKALPRDVDQKSIIPLKPPTTTDELELD